MLEKFACFQLPSVALSRQTSNGCSEIENGKHYQKIAIHYLTIKLSIDPIAKYWFNTFL